MTIIELDQKARDFLTLSGRMREQGLREGDLRILAELYIAHEGVSLEELRAKLKERTSLFAAVVAGHIEKGWVVMRGTKMVITRHGRALLEEVLA